MTPTNAKSIDDIFLVEVLRYGVLMYLQCCLQRCDYARLKSRLTVGVPVEGPICCAMPCIDIIGPTVD